MDNELLKRIKKNFYKLGGIESDRYPEKEHSYGIDWTLVGMIDDDIRRSHDAPGSLLGFHDKLRQVEGASDIGILFKFPKGTLGNKWIFVSNEY